MSNTVFGVNSNPFMPAKFGFYVTAIAGASPLGVVFQPTTAGGVGYFHWDFNGDGVEDEITQFHTSHVFTEPGVYSPKAKFFDSTGYTYDAQDTCNIRVFNSFPSVSGNPSNEHNEDWSTAEHLQLGSSVDRICNFYNFYRVRVNQPGIYLVKTEPIGEPVKRGVKLTVYSESGFVRAFSGGNGNYGWLAVKLDYGIYYFRVETSETTKYRLTFKIDDGERPPVEDNGTTGIFTGQMVEVLDPETDFSGSKFIRYYLENNWKKLSIKLPQFQEKIDVYVGVGYTNQLFYLTNNLQFVKQSTPFLTGVTDSNEITLFTFPGFTRRIGATIYLVIVPEGMNVEKAIETGKYTGQYLTI